MKCLKNIICILVISWIGFIFLSLTSGGERIREFGDKAEGIIREGAYTLADKADGIKETVDGITGKVRKWSGKSKEEDEKAPGNGKEPKKKGTSGK